MQNSEIEGVSAKAEITSNHNFGEIDDSASLEYTMKDGSVGRIVLDYLRPEDAPTHGDDTMRVEGNLGIVEVKDEKAFFTIDGDKNELPLSEELPIYADFINQIITGEPGRNPASDVFSVAKLCIQTQNAADLGQIIHL